MEERREIERGWKGKYKGREKKKIHRKGWKEETRKGRKGIGKQREVKERQKQ